MREYAIFRELITNFEVNLEDIYISLYWKSNSFI